MVYTAIFQNREGHFTYVQSPGPPDRQAAWKEFQNNHAPSSMDCLMFMVLGNHEILDHENVHRPPERSAKDIDVFDLNVSPDSSVG
tara:strand:- start:175 stop:432 length:258 start_codon:yes stop_codon:yes gene_type:complete